VLVHDRVESFHASMMTLFVVVSLLLLVGHHLLPFR
jgi:hypothetical protein